MDRQIEIRTGRRIAVGLERIRYKIGLLGVVGRWHISKANDILRHKRFFELYLGSLFDEQGEIYLSLLPTLIAEVDAQDRRCDECWESRPRQDGSDYRVERDKLAELCRRFEFRSKMYEQLARLTDKPILNDSRRLLDSGQEESVEAIAIERIVRMRLCEFVSLEDSYADDFRLIDRAREQLFEAHRSFAVNIAESEPGADQSTTASALIGLRRAIGYYDYTSGFTFAEYARWWIEEAIEKRRA